MRKGRNFIKTLPHKGLIIFLIIFATAGYAETVANQAGKGEITEQSAVDQRAVQEKKINDFLISYYKPTYFLPFYYTQSPYQSIYQNITPGNESINPIEAKFQLSVKVPVWQNIFHKASTLYLAYTQLSYWQVYNDDKFFRESNYEPEIFLANKLDWKLVDGWKLNFLNIGVSHQSNGRGGDTERSWNRVYAETIFGKENLMFSIKAWAPIARGSESKNPDITDYLGYERLVVSYKYREQVFSIDARNTVESSFKRGATELTWSFPLTKHLGGYVQFFSGYGQSLIEYNHYTNSMGVGISLSNWI